MNFKIEKNWITKNGHQAVVVFNSLGFRCGYIGLAKDSLLNTELFEKDIQNKIDVHGEISFCKETLDYPLISNGVKWIGFDCGHYDDSKDLVCAQKYFPEIYSLYLKEEISILYKVKDLKFCENECENLSEQIKFFEEDVKKNPHNYI